MLAFAAAALTRRADVEIRDDTAAALRGVRDATRASIDTWAQREMSMAVLLANDPVARVYLPLLLDEPYDELADSMALSALRTHWGPQLALLGYDGFFVIDARNVSVGSMRDENLGTSNLLSAQPEFLESVRAGVPAVSRPMPSDVPLDGGEVGRPTMFVGAPLRNAAGEVFAVFTVRVDPAARLSSLLNSGTQGGAGESYLFDANGLVLNEPRFARDLERAGFLEVGEAAALHIEVRDPGANLIRGESPPTARGAWPLTRAVAHAVETRSDGSDVRGYRDYRGVRVVGAWTWLDEYGFGLVTEQDADEAHAPIRMIQRTVWAIWGAASVLVFGLALGLARVGRRLTRLNDDLERRVEERTREADAASRAKSQFLARMSHEIRTPLNAILGISYLARQHTRDPALTDHLEKIERSGNALLATVNNILDFSKIEAGALRMEEVPFDLDEMLVDVSALDRANDDVELVFDIGSKVPRRVVGDPTRLRQVVTNLVGNALKFTERGIVCVRVRGVPAAGRVALTIEVEDSGIGLDPDRAEHLFEEFQQADGSTTRRYGGSGLGLAITRRLVEGMGGTIRADGRLGVGSTFTVELDLEVDQIAPAQADVLARLRGRRALVVDDSPVWRSILCAAVSGLELECTAVASGDEALARLAEPDAAFDIIFLDWRMPGTDGLTVARRVARMASAPTVIMVTSAGAAELVRASGGYPPPALYKPFARSTLIDAVVGQLEPSLRSHTPNGSAIDAARRLEGVRVLLVEDHAINQEVGRGILERAGAKVDIAENGAVGFNAAKHVDYDVVLMDLQMPVLDGWGATEAIRAEQRLAELPIVAMTADAIPEHRERCYEVGMNDFLSKPFVPDALVQVVARWAQVAPVDVGALRRGAPSDTVTASASAKTRFDRPDAAGTVPVFDAEEGLRNLDGDYELWSDSIGRFDEELTKLREAMTPLGDDDDAERIARALHTLKGLAATLGGMELAEVAKAYEPMVADRGRISDDGLDAVDAAIARYRSAAARAVAASRSATWG